MRAHDAGLHLKTAGTTWLEEIIGLALGGPEGLAIAKNIYLKAYEHCDALCAPYASVINIHKDDLPTPQVVSHWSAQQFAEALRHNLKCMHYNPSLRQLLHVGYKVAAQMESRYLEAVDQFAESVGRNVEENLFERHIRPVFLGQ